MFELDQGKHGDLRRLAEEHSERDIVIAPPGDSNEVFPRTVPIGSIPEKEATFVLVDQRTTECAWATVQHASRLKAAGYKPEIFYFFAQAWLNRALKTRSAPISLEETDRWWGRSDWDQLLDMNGIDRARLFSQRFQNELGYATATPWPIKSRSAGGQVMFWMIHATDHDRAPALMRRAYEWAISPVVDDEAQLRMELGDLGLLD